MSRMIKVVLGPLVFLASSMGGSASAQEAFVPSQYAETVEQDHASGAQGHVVTVRKVTAAVENMNSGKVSVSSVTQVLDCRTGKLVSQSRCNPCEYNAAEWPKRPVDVWFAEASWPSGSEVKRRKANIAFDHYVRYFQLEPMDGVDHMGIHYQFWRFDGRRAVPLRAKNEPEPEPAVEPQPEIAPEGPRFGPVQKVEIFAGDTRPDEVSTEPGQDQISLKAGAYAAPQGSTVLSLVDDFSPLWSTSCGSLSSKTAKEVVFTLTPGIDSCKIFLFEGRTGQDDAVTVLRGKKVPSVRVAITFEGGREADGIALTGSARNIQLEAHAFDPAGQEITSFVPEWSVEGGRVEFLDNDTRRRLKVHLDPGAEKTLVRARDPKTGAEDEFLIQLRN